MFRWIDEWKARTRYREVRGSLGRLTELEWWDITEGQLNKILKTKGTESEREHDEINNAMNMTSKLDCTAIYAWGKSMLDFRIRCGVWTTSVLLKLGWWGVNLPKHVPWASTRSGCWLSSEVRHRWRYRLPLPSANLPVRGNYVMRQERTNSVRSKQWRIPDYSEEGALSWLGWGLMSRKGGHPQKILKLDIKIPAL